MSYYSNQGVFNSTMQQNSHVFHVSDALRVRSHPFLSSPEFPASSPLGMTQNPSNNEASMANTPLWAMMGDPHTHTPLVLENDIQRVDDTGDVSVRASGRQQTNRLEEAEEGERTHPRIVRRTLISRSAPHPRSRKTPRGGRMMAKMILQISLCRGELQYSCWLRWGSILPGGERHLGRFGFGCTKRVLAGLGFSRS
jgi:hypothetical protein